jgi:hypothetical protein
MPPATGAPDPLRLLLQTVSQLATRLQEWSQFLTQLRTVAGQIDALTAYVRDSATGTPAAITADAWRASQQMWDTLDRDQLEELREGVQVAQGIKDPSPVPRPGGDLTPDPVLKDLDAWLEAIRAARADGAAGKLRDSCEQVQRKLLKHVRVCFAQLKHETQTLTALVRQIQDLLFPPEAGIP